LQYRVGCDEIKGFILIKGFDINEEGELREWYYEMGNEYLLQIQDKYYPGKIYYFSLGKIIGNLMDKKRKRTLNYFFTALKDEKGLTFTKTKDLFTEKEITEYVFKRCASVGQDIVDFRGTSTPYPGNRDIDW